MPLSAVAASGRKRAASPTEGRGRPASGVASSTDAASPPLVADVLRIIFEFFVGVRHRSTWTGVVGAGVSVYDAPPHDTGVTPDQRRKQRRPIQAARRVCKKWATEAGLLVRELFVPLYAPGAIDLAAAFPAVSHIHLNQHVLTEEEHAQLQAALHAYARLGTLVCLADHRPPAKPTRQKLDLCGSFFIARGGPSRFVNPFLWAQACPLMSNPAHLHVWLDGDTVESTVRALVRATSIEFMTVYPLVNDPLDSRELFGAKEIWINRTTYYMPGLSHFPEVIAPILRPGRWVGGKLPAVFILVSTFPGTVENCIADIVRLAAEMPRDLITLYAPAGELRYDDCGLPVADVELLNRG